ncbi:exodeoxyribonuclease VII small subunit [bacterium]|nr:exodeoxyribonuclease VII small subunit [bacterium]
MHKKAKVSKKIVSNESKPPSFEKALERLEDIVSQLEAAEAPLEKALVLYEEGVGLSRFCSQQLKSAERKVELLEDKNNMLRGRPFVHESGSVAGNEGFAGEGVDYGENDKEEEGEDEGDEEESEADEETDESSEKAGTGLQTGQSQTKDEGQERLF